MQNDRRTFLRNAATGAATVGIAGLAASTGALAAERTFTPEMFGAKGDGVTNDTDAFATMADAVNINRGGVVVLRRTTYLVGKQIPSFGSGRDYAFLPAKLMEFRNCTKPLEIRGKGATIRCAAGLRFGTFDPRTGEPKQHGMPYFERKELASPYASMINVSSCSGPLLIEDLELDGNLGGLKVGGQYGDTGWQILATGILLGDNQGDEIIRNVHAHHHPQDGLMISGSDDAALARRVTRRIENFRAEYNGRQGCSLIGGRGYAFSNCKFNHTGKGAIASAPGAGVDIEAEGKLNRDHSFVDCEFADNWGPGMVADSGDSEGATFTGCKFVGTTSWSAWPNKPGFRFRNCTFAGALVRCFGDADPRRAAQFYNCRMSDDPRQWPKAKLYFSGGRPDGTIADLSDTRNVLFSGCTFDATHGAVLPWSVFVIYDNCTMRQTSTTQAYPRGTFRGRNIISGNVDLYNSTFTGDTMLNGRPVPRNDR